MRQLTRVSNSQFSAYHWCKHQWELRYLKGLSPPKKAHALTFGIAFHAAIETYLKRNSDPTAVALAMFEEAYRAERGDEPDHWVPHGNMMLRNMFESISQKNLEIVNLEQFLRKQLTDRITYVGKIDCIGILDGTKFVIDWKTSGSEYTPKKVKEDNQLTSYAWLTGINDCMFVVCNKETGEVTWHPTKRSNTRIRRYVREMIETCQEIEQREEFPGEHNWKCQWCDLTPSFCRGDSDF